MYRHEHYRNVNPFDNLKTHKIQFVDSKEAFWEFSVGRCEIKVLRGEIVGFENYSIY